MNEYLGELETIVVVMMENRSFDHMLGYLSLSGRDDIEGLKRQSNGKWPESYGNDWKGRPRFPYALSNPIVKVDPGHERPAVAKQIQKQGDGTFRMGGFVQDYLQEAGGSAEDEQEDRVPVMGYYTADWVPVYDYFAEHYAVCDHWFSCLPTETQPNRLMALSGHTMFDHGMILLQEPDDLIFRWLDERKVKWGYYRDGKLCFLNLMTTSYSAESLRELPGDLCKSDFPELIWIDPTVTLWSVGKDDHPPASILDGQRFVGELYKILRSSPRWSKTLMIITYDEHGGFFDHVSPIPLQTPQPVGGSYWGGPFETSGIRVPAFLISPYVTPRSVFKKNVDHTCILKLVGEKFGRASERYRYNDDVNGTNRASLASLSEALSTSSVPPSLSLIEQALERISLKAATLLPRPKPVETLVSATGDLRFTQKALPQAKRRRRSSAQVGKEVRRLLSTHLSLEAKEFLADRSGLTHAEMNDLAERFLKAGEQAIVKRLERGKKKKPRHRADKTK